MLIIILSDGQTMVRAPKTNYIKLLIYVKLSEDIVNSAAVLDGINFFYSQTCVPKMNTKDELVSWQESPPSMVECMPVFSRQWWVPSM